MVASLMLASLLPVVLGPTSFISLKGRPERIPLGIGFLLYSSAYVLVFLKLGFVAPITLLDRTLQGIVIGTIVCVIWATITLVRQRKQRRPPRHRSGKHQTRRNRRISRKATTAH
ncbi:MAG: hypothetical protein ABSF63_14740 [Candidatus Bathyarchaeia archaeon]